MHPLLPILTHISATAAQSLIAATWQGILIAAAIALILRGLPSIAAATRSLIWMTAFLLVAALHLIPLHSAQATPGASQALPAFQAFYLDPRWSLAIAALWLALSLLRATRLGLAAFRLRRIARNATPLPIQLPEARRQAQICTSPDVDRPSVAGFFHPRILLPPSLVSHLTPSELRQVTLHELEHLRRRDDWTNLLQKIGLVLFPLNPAMIWLEKRLCQERELACDDSVLSATGTPKAYAACLANLAERGLLHRTGALVLGLLDRQSHLAHRIHRILSRPTPTLSPRSTRAVTASLVAVLITGTAALAHTPQLITFTPAHAAATPTEPRNLLPLSASQPRAYNAPAHMVLAKAIMPTPATFTPRPRPTPAKLAIARRPRIQPSLVTLTSADQNSRQTTHITLTVFDTTQASYAAVPTPNGWLIIQL
jgi:beta-lactamase regulating signal transducer with metallopeptidase domain